MKLNSWLETGLDGDVLLTPYVPKGITGYDDDDNRYLLKYLGMFRPVNRSSSGFQRVSHR